jgi:hypothetical protein
LTENIKKEEMPGWGHLSVNFLYKKLVQSVNKLSASLELSNLLGSNLNLSLC